jgi:2-dehydropantoate 2-reductase
MVQATTFGENNGTITARIKELESILKNAGFSTDICKNMDAWQKTHVAMFCTLVNVIHYNKGESNYSVAKNADAIKQLNLALKENFRFIKKSGIGIVPSNLTFLLYAPLGLLNFIMKHAYNTKWAETNFYTPAITTPKEFELLSSDFIKLAESKGFDLKEFKKLTYKNSQAN